MEGLILSVGLAGGLLGAIAIGLQIFRSRGKQRQHTPSPADGESLRQEAKRYFLMNETGNVLIASSVSPSERLPDITLTQFSEALAHLSAIFFAVAGTTDPETGQPFSLYNYAVIKKALAQHPVFIRMSSEKPKVSADRLRPRERFLQIQSTPKSPEVLQKEKQQWLDDRVNYSRVALGMADSPDNVRQLQSIHGQMRAEAKRMRRSAPRALSRSGDLFLVQASSASLDRAEVPDEMEIGHITLYCECLMGVSLISIKLAHAYYEDYLSTESFEKMEYDTYLFVSPSQLRKTIADLNNLPRVSFENTPSPAPIVAPQGERASDLNSGLIQ